MKWFIGSVCLGMLVAVVMIVSMRDPSGAAGSISEVAASDQDVPQAKENDSAMKNVRTLDGIVASGRPAGENKALAEIFTEFRAISWAKASSGNEVIFPPGDWDHGRNRWQKQGSMRPRSILFDDPGMEGKQTMPNKTW